jgi:hypothetical protein
LWSRTLRYATLAMTLGRSGSELEVFDILDVISLLVHMERLQRQWF